MINKIYKFRPLSEFLFKELYYNELYFASYPELNDPLDLTAKLNFKPKDAKVLDYLIYSLIKISIFPTYEEHIKGIDITPSSNLTKFAKDMKKRLEFCDLLFSKIEFNSDLITYDAILEKLKPLAKKNDFNFRYDAYEKEIQRLINVFFQNSYSTSFSKTNSDFLMWSHYASKHESICLEFTLNDENLFPYIISGRRENNENKYFEQHSKWNVEYFMYWEMLHKVEYVKEISTINYFDFAPVFENEGDCDLMGLSKSNWWGYAGELMKLFSTKTIDWKYEEEWRAIKINFNGEKFPEDRIRHYPSEALSAIYFGIRTPDKVKERIFDIIKQRRSETDFYVAELTDNRKLEFKEWFSEVEE